MSSDDDKASENPYEPPLAECDSPQEDDVTDADGYTKRGKLSRAIFGGCSVIFLPIGMTLKEMEIMPWYWAAPLSCLAIISVNALFDRVAPR